VLNLEAVAAVLDAASIRVGAVQEGDVLHFEDSTIVGFVSLHPTVADLVTRWEKITSRFLNQYAAELRTAPIKAWNAYSIFLTGDNARTEDRKSLSLIEEDFRGSRKIAKAGVTTNLDIVHGLLPILPIQTAIKLPPEDVGGRIMRRLAVSDELKRMLFSSSTATEVLRAFLEKI
jgi:hypothetical protein